MISLNRLGQVWAKEGALSLYSRFGLSGASLERAAGFTRPNGDSYRVTQVLRLFSLRAGLELQGPAFAGIQPFGDFSLLPTLALATESALEPSVSRFGLPMEAAAGLLAKPLFLSHLFGIEQGALGLGAHYVFGTVDNAKMNALGLEAFFRADL
jgi:hypothetical protein